MDGEKVACSAGGLALKGVRIQSSPERLVITNRQGSRWARLIVLVLFGAMASFPAGMIIADGGRHHIPVVLTIIVVVGSLGLWWLILAATINRQVLVVTVTRISSWTGPIPGPWGGGSCDTRELHTISIVRRNRIMAGSGTFYTLKATTTDGRSVLLSGGYNDPNIPIALGRLVNERLPAANVLLGVSAPR